MTYAADPHELITIRSVKVISARGTEVAAALRVREWSAAQRTSRAWKRLALWWCGGVLGAAMPPHIPWLTIGLVGGPIAAWLASRQGALIHEQEIACPDCGALARIEEQGESWPLGARCEPCRAVFWVEGA